MKSWKFLLIFTIFLIPVVFADNLKTIHDGWHFSNETFKVDSLTIKLTGTPEQDSVMLDYGENRFMLKNNTCEETPKYFFCIDSTKEEGFDHKWRVWLLKYHILVKQKLAKLEFTRTVSQTSLIAGQLSKISFHLTNTGSFIATDVHVEDPFPGFAISDVQGCSVGDNVVVWDGTLNSKQELTCSYTITALRNGSLQSKASASFFDGASTATASSGVTGILVAGNDLKWSTTPSLILELSQSGKVVVVMNNTLPKEVIVKSLVITIPYGLTVSEPHFWSKVNDYRFQYSISLAAGNSKVLDLTVVAERAKKFVLPVVIDYEVDSIQKHSQRNVTVSVSLSNLTVSYAGTANFTAAKTARVIATIINPSVLQTFHQIDAKFIISCLNLTVARKFQEILPKQPLDIFSDVVDIPSQKGPCLLKTTLNYDTSFGQHVTFVKQQNMTIAVANSSKIPPKSAPVSNTSKSKPTQIIDDNELLGENPSSFNIPWIPIIGGFVFIVLLVTFFVLKKGHHGSVSKEELAVAQKELMTGKEDSQTKGTDKKVRTQKAYSAPVDKKSEVKAKPAMEKPAKKEKPSKKDKQSTQSYRF